MELSFRYHPHLFFCHLPFDGYIFLYTSCSETYFLLVYPSNVANVCLFIIGHLEVDKFFAIWPSDVREKWLRWTEFWWFFCRWYHPLLVSNLINNWWFVFIFWYETQSTKHIRIICMISTIKEPGVSGTSLFIWWCPEIGLPRVIIHSGVCHEINHP